MMQGQPQARRWKGDRSSSGLGVGSESARRGQRVGVILLRGILFASWKKGWRSPRSTLCAYPARSRDKSWLGSTPSFNPALQGSWVRPGVVSFPCARHGSTCPVWGPALVQAWGIPSLWPWGQRGVKDLLGPWSLPPPSTWSPGQHGTAAYCVKQADRSRNGMRWGGSE